MIDPLPNYRFFVTLDPADAYLPPEQAMLVPLVAVGAFQEVRGLGGDLEVTPHAEGGRNDFVHQLPVRYTWSRITLRTGVTTLPALWEWYSAGLAQALGARRDGAIWLLTPAGIPAVSWEFRAGIAVKWTGPDLNAMQGSIAVESLEIAHHGIHQIRLPVPT